MLRHRNTVSRISALILLDQASKRMFYDWELLPRIFRATINTGAARSLPIPEAVIGTVAVAMTIYVVHLYRRKEIKDRGAILFIAGIWGNIADRILYAGVRDFIYIGDWRPIFNMADTYLTIAVIIMIRHEITHHPKHTS